METILLRRHIVPIVDLLPNQSQNGIEKLHYFGTGVCVAKGWILTCAHVVNNAQNILSSVSREKTYSELKEIRLHDSVDLALARLHPDVIDEYDPIPVGVHSDRNLGASIWNYSYTKGYHPEYKLAVTPRLMKGSIIRESIEHVAPNTPYFEVDFPALSGMSGSPIVDNSQPKVVGIIYKNFRSSILDDIDEEHMMTDGEVEIVERRTTYRVAEYGLAIDLSKFMDFFQDILD